MRNPSLLQNAKPQTSVRSNQSINIPALFQQATHWHQQGDLNKAEQLYLQLVARKPHHFDALHHLCMIALQKKELSQALNWIDRALIENPLHALAHANRGIVLHHLQRYAEAVRSYDRAIRLHPQYAQAYCNRGIALRELGSVDLAISSYDQAIALKPDYAEAYANRGNAYLKLNALEQALQDASRAIQLKPKMAHIATGVSFGMPCSNSRSPCKMSIMRFSCSQIMLWLIGIALIFICCMGNLIWVGKIMSGVCCLSIIRRHISQHHAGVVRSRCRENPSCCMPSKAWATPCNFAVMSHWSRN